MAEKIRVHNLAKELGVDSKAILEKCSAEGIDSIKNHMSTLSVGLAETIREWFSEGMHATVIETSERVDLDQVRKTAKRRRRKKDEESAVAVADTLTEEDTHAIVEPAAETGMQAEVAEAGTEAVAEVFIADEEIVSAGPEAPLPGIGAEEPVTERVVIETAAQAAAEAAEPGPGTSVEIMEPEPALQPEPEPMKPAGPQNIPAPAKLQGPRVVRVERPDNLAPPRPSVFRGPAPVPSVRQYHDVDSEEYAEHERGGRKKHSGGTDVKKDTGRSRINPRRSAARGSDAGERLKEWRDRDLLEREERLRAASGRGLHARRAAETRTVVRGVTPRKTKIQLTEPIQLSDFSAASGIRSTELVKKLLTEHKIAATKNMILDVETAGVLALECGIELEIVKPKSPLDLLKEEFERRERPNHQPRPPVVAFLGHVDHGKTSLLDAIRKTRVTEGEAGGITQHIGAYRLDRDGLSVTFLDTPGHEAFTAMRARGANMTDVVVLVVAADDGLMTQTIEAINHAKAAGVAIVVALNKIDLPNAGKDRVYGQLAEQQLVPAEWGGDVDVIPTSAVTGEGIDRLVQHLAMLSELMDLRGDPTVPATGVVIESELKEGVGPVARLLVQEGTLRNGDVIVCGPAFGRVRSMSDDLGRRLEKAGPATPIELTGLSELPDAGDRFYQVENLQRAKDLAKDTRDQRREKSLATSQKPKSLEDLFAQRDLGEIPRVNTIIKADTQGSIDALTKSLSDLPSDEVKLNVLHAGVGGVNEGDVVLAEASKAIIVGFNVVPESGVQRIADEKGVEIRLYRVIYDLLDDIRQALEGKLTPEEKLEVRGRAEVRSIFNISRVGTVAGCYVTDGTVARNHKVRILRDSVVVRDRCDLDSLKRFKDDAREVRSGFECGIKIDGFNDVKPGDIIEAYEIVKVARKL